ncbi:unnamed protein product [Medioppia subpectinata]|uniref:Tetraspanin n=1 Tax=Medioppia subpectinata TaxID=1979941 RepID=A0A7R9L7G2_9ACAR|nr:unnamed protein product [Medioppia subpectinata]CAG2116699.1 unnamed protein product [Medioppia subpectinata]
MGTNISCGAACIKYLLFIFNILWLIFAVVIIVLGFKCIDWSGDIEHIYNNSIKTGAGIVIAVGFLILIMAFIGCCGAITQNVCLLSTYSGIILILVIVEIVGVVLVFIYKNEIENELKTALSREFGKWNGPTARAVQVLQQRFRCCGVTDYRSDFSGESVPASCCDQWATGEAADKTCPKMFVQFSKGCADTIRDTINNYLWGIGGVAIALVVIQLLLVVSACCLAREL